MPLFSDRSSLYFLMGTVFVATFIFIAEGRTETAESYTIPIVRLSESHLATALQKLHFKKGLSVEIFYKPLALTTPFSPPPHAVEMGARCLLSNKKDVAELLKIIKHLSIKGEWNDWVSSNLEIRFIQSGRIIFSGLFADRASRDARGKLVSAAMIDDRSALFDYGAIDQLLQFARARMTGPGAGKLCDEFRK